jgi:hypothetical protein
MVQGRRNTTNILSRTMKCLLPDSWTPHRSIRWHDAWPPPRTFEGTHRNLYDQQYAGEIPRDIDSDWECYSFSYHLHIHTGDHSSRSPEVTLSRHCLCIDSECHRIYSILNIFLYQGNEITRYDEEIFPGICIHDSFPPYEYL